MRLYATESRLGLDKFPPPAGLDPGTARPAGHRLTFRAAGAPLKYECMGE